MTKITEVLTGSVMYEKDLIFCYYNLVIPLLFDSLIDFVSHNWQKYDIYVSTDFNCPTRKKFRDNLNSIFSINTFLNWEYCQSFIKRNAHRQQRV